MLHTIQWENFQIATVLSRHFVSDKYCDKNWNGNTANDATRFGNLIGLMKRFSLKPENCRRAFRQLARCSRNRWKYKRKYRITLLKLCRQTLFFPLLLRLLDSSGVKRIGVGSFHLVLSTVLQHRAPLSSLNIISEAKVLQHRANSHHGFHSQTSASNRHSCYKSMGTISFTSAQGCIDTIEITSVVWDPVEENAQLFLSGPAAADFNHGSGCCDPATQRCVFSSCSPPHWGNDPLIGSLFITR